MQVFSLEGCKFHLSTRNGPLRCALQWKYSPMNKYAKIAEGLAAWLMFEQRCGRSNLFSESSLAHPLGQLLQYRFPGRVHAEVEHPILAPKHIGVGQKPRIDFAVKDETGAFPFDLVVETKWVSGSPNLLRDILRDLVRLDLIRRQHARDALFILAGEMKAIRKLFQAAAFQPVPNHANSRTLLPLNPLKPSASLRFSPVPKARKSLYTRALAPFTGVELSELLHLRFSGPFPRNANSTSYGIYLWRLVYPGTGRFLPEQEYRVGNDSLADAISMELQKPKKDA